jgi:hypothetical protein
LTFTRGKAVHGAKNRIFHSNFLRALIHPFHERLFAAGVMDCQRRRGVIRRLDDERVQ